MEDAGTRQGPMIGVVFVARGFGAVGRCGTWEGNLMGGGVGRRRGEDCGRGVVPMREGYLGGELEREVVRSKVDEVGKVACGDCNLGCRGIFSKGQY